MSTFFILQFTRGPGLNAVHRVQVPLQLRAVKETANPLVFTGSNQDMCMAGSAVNSYQYLAASPTLCSSV